jgi:AP-4 complex subunit epsilon-1
MEDPSEAEATTHYEPDFESIWNALDQSSGARGWCDGSIDGVVRRLQGLGHRLKVIAVDRPPFEGMSFCIGLFTAVRDFLFCEKVI